MADLYGSAGGSINPSPTPDPPVPGMGGTLYIKSNDGSETLYSKSWEMRPGEEYSYLDTVMCPKGIYSDATMEPSPTGYILLFSLANYPGLNTSPNQSDPNIISGQTFGISSSDVTVYVASGKKAINKIIKNGETVLDLTGDTITPDTLGTGVTAHNSAGKPIIGKGSIKKNLKGKAIYITENGEFEITPDTGYDGMDKASVLVAVPSGGHEGIYGAEWAGTSDPSWMRTDDAASFSDPVPYVAGATNYGSPFDNIMPWAGMQIVEDAEAGILVSIPKFWYKLSGGGGSPLKIQIANHYVDGYSVSPMHMDRGDGKGERGIAFIGRYHCDTNYKSTTGVKPKVNITRSTARSGIHALGNNVWQGDFAMRFTIWLLYLVEYADWGSQWIIGAGCGDSTSPPAPGVFGGVEVGYTDSMPYHTGTNLSSKRTFGYGTQYRYIEGLWDNCFDWMDGCYYNSSGLNLIKNPSNFSDSSGGSWVGLPSDDYSCPSVMTVSTTGGYPVFYPTVENGGPERTSGAIGSPITGAGSYVPDRWSFNSSYPCLYAGGYFSGSALYGLFFVNSNGSTYAFDSLGCRLQKLP